jgi:chromosome segregation ATPase
MPIKLGGTTKVPILPGFTVVSGPNGSGKSNILDALLFCLGLARSKGMRAERLPDLINHDRSTKGVSEAIVTVTSIISMNSKERREIIDELAGVAAFDLKIVRAKDTLDEVVLKWQNLQQKQSYKIYLFRRAEILATQGKALLKKSSSFKF